MTWPTPAADTMLNSLLAGIDAVLPQANQLRRAIHRNPDLGGAEGPTAARIAAALPGLATTPVAGTGFLVRTGEDSGPSVALRADMDALPVVEQTAVSWSATGRAMHACGHDVHMAATWAVLAAARSARLPLGVVGIFQPREEVQPSGGEDIANSGLLEAEQVKAVLGIHVQPRVPAGLVSTGTGGVNAAADEFEIVVHGHPGHGAYPHIAVDPIPVLAAIVLGLQELVIRTVDPTHPGLITVGQIQAGATHNVIPATGSMRGIIRTMSVPDQQRLHQAVKDLAEHTAAARGARAEVRIITGDPVLANDARLVQTVDPLLNRTGLLVAHQPFRSLGADDFSHYSRIAPILMMFVGTGAATPGQSSAEVGLHHPRYLPDEATVRRCAHALAAGVVGAAQLTGRLGLEPDQASEIKSA